jgi:hypothetical protein
VKTNPINCVAPLTVVILICVAAYTIAALQLPKMTEQVAVVSLPFVIIAIGLTIQRKLRRIK